MQLNSPPILVIVGAWNHLIFSREWIKVNLYLNEDVIIDDPLAPNSSFVFGTEDYKIFLQENKLNFLAIKQTPEIYNIIEQKANQILSKLQHTPLSAFGLNFGFNLKYNAHLNAIRPVTDQAYFRSKGYFEDMVLLHRTFTKDNYILGVIANFLPYEVKIEVNIHFQINDSALFIKLFQPGILQSKKLEVAQLVESHYEK